MENTKFYTQLDAIFDIRTHTACAVDHGMVRACRHGHLEVVKYLLELGATRLNRGLIAASMGSHVDVCKYLIDLGACDFENALVVAKSFPVVELLVGRGASNFDAALESVCWSERPDRVAAMEFLIRRGARHRMYVEMIEDYVECVYCSEMRKNLSVANGCGNETPNIAINF